MLPTDRICIVMMSAIGDAVHALPVLNALKRDNPGRTITWVLQPGPASLVREHPSVDEVILFHRDGGWRAVRDVARELRSRKFDLLIDLQVYFKAGIITALSGAPLRLGFDRRRARDANYLFTNRRIPPHEPQHVQEQYFEFLDYLGIAAEPVEWTLGPTESEKEWQREFTRSVGREYAAIVVGTSHPERDWIPERWGEVCDILENEHGLRAVFVGSDSQREQQAAARIAARAKLPPVNALGSGLRRLVAILDASSLVISPDTGPLHISVALDRPVISLTGFHDPRRTGPFRRFHDLIIDAYHDPGESGPVTMKTRPGRMQRIQVADVADRLKKWSERYRANE